MKIAIVAPLVSAIREPQGGGSQAFVADLSRGLTGRGHEVHVYAASGSQIPGVTVIDTGVDHRSLAATLYRAAGPAPRDQDVTALAFARVYALLGQVRYDVVHNHAFDAPAISLAGALTAPKISMQPGLSSDVIILSFAIVVIGGLGSVGGAAVGAVLVGLARAASVHLMPQAELFMIYLIMAAGLMFRPEGLFTRETARRI